jgi:hypothetical protein
VQHAHDPTATLLKEAHVLADVALEREDGNGGLGHGRLLGHGEIRRLENS